MVKKIEIIKVAKDHGLKIEWSDYLIAARSKDILFINPNLVKYDKFCEDTLKHEFKHTGDFTKKDFIMDMTEGSLYDSLLFCFRHPKAFCRFIPIAFYNKELHVDINTIFIYLIIIGLILFLAVLW